MLWRQILRQNFTSWEKLSQFLGIELPLVLKNPSFPLNLPLRLAQKIDKKNPNDPILKQFLPTTSELEITPGFSLDPVQDQTFRKERKLLQKYHGRALVTLTGACAMNCRFCFRKNFDYETEEKSFEKEIELIKQDPSLKEIILSGGDPLSLSNEKLGEFINAIPHIKKIRFHTRFPIGIPERIDEGFLEILKNAKSQIIFVIHCNHANELDNDIFLSLKKIQCLGIPILNQSVLLKGVNDTVLALKELSESLVDHGIIPYYLHQLDKVSGASHFEVPKETGLQLVHNLLSLLPGYAVPRYVEETAGEAHKTIVQT